MAQSHRQMSGVARGALLLILASGFALRLVCLRSPLLDEYAWRQTNTAMVARNFHRHGYRLLWPEVDLNGNGPAWVDSEFPLYPFATALLYRVFGEREALGRLLNALIAVATAYLVYLLAARHYGFGAGLWASAIFSASPILVFFGRNFQPDFTMLFFGVAGLYALCVALEENRVTHLALSALCLAIAAMIKPTILHVLIPAAYLWQLNRGSTFLRSAAAWTWLAAVLVPTGLWYAHARHLGELSGVSFLSVGSGNWIQNVARWDLPGVQNIIWRLEVLVFTPLGVIFMLPSLARRSEVAGQLHPLWLASGLIYVGLLPHLNKLHHYYQLPLFPPATILMGATIAGAPSRMRAILYGGFMVVSLSFAWSFVIPWYHWDRDVLNCGRIVTHLTAPRDLLIAVEPYGGALVYCSDRKGFQFFATMMTTSDLTSCVNKGARTLAIAPSGYWTHLQPEVVKRLRTEWELARDTSQYRVYRLRQTVR